MDDELHIKRARDTRRLAGQQSTLQHLAAMGLLLLITLQQTSAEAQGGVSASASLPFGVNGWSWLHTKHKLHNHEQKPAFCKDGLLRGVPRSHFWEYGHEENYTIGLTDVLTSEGRVYAVLNLKTSDRSVDWQPAKWEIQFKELNGKQQSATSLGIDPHQHTFIVYTSLPEEFATLNPGFVWHVSITATLPGRTYTYKDVPFCLHPDQTNIGKAAKPSKRHLIACTQVINDDLHDIPEWVAYHLVQGFQHFYVYVNSPPRQARWFLKQLVDAGVLTIIDWNFPDRYTGKFTYQMAQQNSCLLRSRGRAAWVGLFDVDEFFQPMAADNVTVAAILESLENLASSASAVRAQNWFFGSPQPGQKLDPCKLKISTYIHRQASYNVNEREKLFARPENVQYTSIHMVTLAVGKSMHTLNALTEMRLVHYKLPHTQEYLAQVKDDSMVKYAAPVHALMQPWCGQ